MTNRHILLAAGVLALVAFLPLRIALGGAGGALSARNVEGSVWSGRLTQVALGGQPLGDLEAGLSPFRLMLGQARVNVKGALNGAIVTSLAGRGADVDTLVLPMSRALGPVRLTSLSVSDAHVRFRGGGCAEADGRVTVQFESPMGPRTSSGSLKCVGPDLAATLLSQSAMERLVLRFPDSGRYEATLTIRSSDADQAMRLNRSGFRETASGHLIRFSGAL